VIGVAIASFLLLLVVTYLIARPFLAPQATEGDGEVQLTEDHERVLSQIRDLDMEFATGKLSEDEYHALRARRLEEAEATERALSEFAAPDVVGPAETEGFAMVSGNGDAPAATDDDLERAIAARRRSMQERSCSSCGALSDPDDRFCRHCGNELTPAQTR
jgi:hypothetical protein